MNVLIYNGPGTSQSSVTGALSSLTALLSPHYSIRLISPSAIITEPWSSTTSLLVIPGGRDLPYCTALNGEGTRKMEEYVRRGGSYLGFCAGSYFASKTVEFEVGTPIAVQGSRELGFWKGISRGCAFPGFVYDSEDGAKVAKLQLEHKISQVRATQTDLSRAMSDVQLSNEESLRKRSELGIYWNGGGVFVDAEESEDVEVLARYTEAVKVQGGSAAIISLKCGRGKVVLSAVHPEISPAKQSKISEDKKLAGGQTQSGNNAAPQLSASAEAFIPNSELKLIRKKQTHDRLALLKMLLSNLGLRTNDSIVKAPPLSTLHLLSYSDKVRTHAVEALKSAAKTIGNSSIIKGEQDAFHIITDPSQRPAENNADIDELDSPNWTEQVKYISTHRHPPEFPLFNTKRYFALLHRIHYASQPPSKTYSDPTFGTSLLYAETVTSSQSLLDKNIAFQRHLPDGFTILCSHQLSGRGRGQNAWISPAGVLSFSTVLHYTPKPQDPPGSIIFIQYLTSLVVIESIKSLRPTLDLKIKWPNDIYFRLPSTSPTPQSSDGAATQNTGEAGTAAGTFVYDGERYAKVSGSLITTSYLSGKYIMTIGIGINVSNPLPTTSLNAFLPASEQLCMEELLARIMVTFQSRYRQFTTSSPVTEAEGGQAKGAGFGVMVSDYYTHWIHTNQSVTIESSNESGTITGIDLTTGNLIVKLDEGGREVGLQSDGNSFDMMKGLIRVKR